MNAFTPGPWGPMTDGPWRPDSWTPWNARGEAAPGLTIGSIHNTEPICRVSGYLQPCIANARLIVAAPDLFDACELALSQLDGSSDFIPTVFVINKLRAAIAKAAEADGSP